MSKRLAKTPLDEADKECLREFLEQKKDSIDESFTQFRETMQTIKAENDKKNTEDR